MRNAELPLEDGGQADLQLACGDSFAWRVGWDVNERGHLTVCAGFLDRRIAEPGGGAVVGVGRSGRHRGAQEQQAGESFVQDAVEGCPGEHAWFLHVST